MPELQIIHSSLVKACQLALSSAQFRPMVQAACIYAGINYTDEVLHRVSTTPSVLDCLELHEGSTIDVSILTKVATVEGAEELDNAITEAVSAYNQGAK